MAKKFLLTLITAPFSPPLSRGGRVGSAVAISFKKNVIVRFALQTVTISAILFLSNTAAAEDLQYQGGYNPNQTQGQYFQNTAYRYDRSIIYVFYNSAMACRSCPKAMEMLEEVYTKNYQNKYDYYTVDYNENRDYNYISAYKLDRPLEVVLAKVRNGYADGYQKIENLQNKTSNKSGFEREVKDKIDGFLR